MSKDQIRIVSTGMAEGTKVYGPGGVEIPDVQSVEVHRVDNVNRAVSATVTFGNVALGEAGAGAKPGSGDFAQGDAMEFSGSPMWDYESAISAVADAASRAGGLTLLILQDHLKKLCDAHLQALKD